jgi:hypothetical protein
MGKPIHTVKESRSSLLYVVAFFIILEYIAYNAKNLVFMALPVPLFLVIIPLIPFLDVYYYNETIRIKKGGILPKGVRIPREIVKSVSIAFFERDKPSGGFEIKNAVSDSATIEMWVTSSHVVDKRMPWLSAWIDDSHPGTKSLIPVQMYCPGVFIETTGNAHYLISDPDPHSTLEEIREYYPVSEEVRTTKSLTNAIEAVKLSKSVED